MNILILNWRDPKNPKSGGAEKLNLQILKPLIERGDTVIWYAQSYNNLPDEELYKGIRIIRKGNALTHFIYWPWLFWTRKFGKVDILIDSIHGTGYLSSLFAPRTRKKILICEVAQNIWDEMYSFPINILGKAWERIQFFFYKREAFWTISESTKQDLHRFGIANKHIQIMPMGFDGCSKPIKQDKEKEPTAVFVGRLAEMKGVKDAITAIALTNKVVNRKWYFRIIGRGDEHYERKLQTLVKKLGLSNYVTFLGYVSEEEKFTEMAKAWLLLVPSKREGWGMIVPEANSVGTIVVGYDVPGLRDAIQSYSPHNKAVPVDIDLLSDNLTRMVKPETSGQKPKAGWNELHAFVKKQL